MLGADPIVFPAVFAALYAAHEVGDHWLQTHRQACGKGAPGWRGRILCARHVATLTAVKAAALALTAVVLGLPVNPYAAAAALAVDAVSHYWADRRSTLLALADWLGRTILPGKGEFARLGDGAAAPTGTGAYALDQSWHIGWLFAAALLASLGVSA
ncbi:transcriptional regulator [Actinomadura madurae]|uniref:transcriptional regulator n=1 Tax=Actinomadura madurae TaxID=1993 RepID=UPI0020D25797|nr:transcriptional regulator [Actinomadura madurae]MCP9951424.1 transcriptional regulator [Actinomadura madurae]MCP9968197.1 transcriptional regulator [Actinomadura madurae]MCP9980654.1 transcriptional regulator [Actinomadura madurae]MCQ0007832.1 transcriptional regulator [Actinomadura madurae]MCQ0016853.1 transcriptional regulator [Actinomadura madurae]